MHSSKVIAMLDEAKSIKVDKDVVIHQYNSIGMDIIYNTGNQLIGVILHSNNPSDPHFLDYAQCHWTVFCNGEPLVSFTDSVCSHKLMLGRLTLQWSNPKLRKGECQNGFCTIAQLPSVVFDVEDDHINRVCVM